MSRITRVLAIAVALSACEPSPFDVVDSATVALDTPPELTLRALDRNNLNLTATVNGSRVSTTRNGDSWEFTARVAPDRTFDVELDWLYVNAFGLGPGDPPLLLARYSGSDSVVGDATITLGFERFDTEGDGFDRDEDGQSNYEEVRDGFDPTNDNVCASCRTDVDLTIPFSSAVPTVDGSYDSPLWTDAAQFDDTEGVLGIDTPLRGDATDDVPYKWSALHDGRDLYVYVFGTADPKTPQFASSDLAEDDSVELHLSVAEGATDGVSDDGAGGESSGFSRGFRLVVPIRGVDGGSNRNELGQILFSDDDFADPQSRTIIEADLFRQAVRAGNVEVGTTTNGSDRDFYEIRVSLDYIGVSPGEILGIEVQLNDDLEDGGDADRRWGWRAPTGSDRLAGISHEPFNELPGRAALAPAR